MPDDMVATAGLPLAVTLVKGWKSKPSLAMANRTLGIGNIEPKRLQGQAESTTNNNSQTSEATMKSEMLEFSSPTAHVTGPTWWTERRANPRLRHIWLGPSRCTQKPRAGGFFHQVCSRASSG